MTLHKYMDALTSTKGWFYTNGFMAITSFASLFYPENVEQTNAYVELALHFVSLICAFLAGFVSAIKIYQWLKTVKW